MAQNKLRLRRWPVIFPPREISYQNGECANGTRMALLEAGWPLEVPRVSIDLRCCSGLDAIFDAMKIQTGKADIVVVVGMDSMSQAELYIPGEIGVRRKEPIRNGVYAKRTWGSSNVGNPPV